MCLFQPPLRNLSRWNWDGDHIIHESIVPSSRRPLQDPPEAPPVAVAVAGAAPAPGRKVKDYEIDVREFLVSANNAVTKRVLHRDLPRHFRALNRAAGRRLVDLGALERRGSGDFDARANLIASYVAATIRYRSTDGRDTWQFPDETLALQSGDCEDIAFVLASLLLASGISGYNVRVALGTVVMGGAPGTAQATHDHMWVMYKCEAGHWLLLEPLCLDAQRPPRPAVARAAQASPASQASQAPRWMEYRPAFLFNDDHLWAVAGQAQEGALKQVLARRWNRLHPSFVGNVHRSILHDALEGLAPAFVLDALDRHFARVAHIGPYVEDIDRDSAHYDSRDHFDNGFIAEGWQQVDSRLAAFRKNNGDLDSFARAAHAIADFYSHSSYLHFAQVENDCAQAYDPQQPAAGLERPFDYGAGTDFDLVSGSFTTHGGVFGGTGAQAAAAWRGEPISGRYAQSFQDSRTALEAANHLPPWQRDSPGFERRGALPHHEEIAVDDAVMHGEHLLYRHTFQPAPDDRLAYSNQFRWRKHTAVRHIVQAFVQNWKGSPDDGG